MKKSFRFFAIALISMGMVMAVSCGKDNEGDGNDTPGNRGNVNNLPTTIDEGFETGVPEGWTNIDADGDGFSWEIGYGPNSGRPGPYSQGMDGSNCILSASYDGDFGPLTPDNYLVSPEIYIPAEGSHTLTWYDAAQDPAYPAEHYAVYVGTLSNGTFTPMGEPIFSITLSSGEFIQRSVSLDSYKDKDIRIAFRHFGVTDMFYMKLDNVKVQ